MNLYSGLKGEGLAQALGHNDGPAADFKLLNEMMDAQEERVKLSFKAFEKAIRESSGYAFMGTSKTHAITDYRAITTEDVAAMLADSLSAVAQEGCLFSYDPYSWKPKADNYVPDLTVNPRGVSLGGEATKKITTISQAGKRGRRLSDHVHRNNMAEVPPGGLVEKPVTYARMWLQDAYAKFPDQFRIGASIGVIHRTCPQLRRVTDVCIEEAAESLGWRVEKTGWHNLQQTFIHAD